MNQNTRATKEETLTKRIVREVYVLSNRRAHLFAERSIHVFLTGYRSIDISPYYCSICQLNEMGAVLNQAPINYEDALLLILKEVLRYDSE